MTSVERLLNRLREMVIVPDVEFQRVYAGRCQREAGAWSWVMTYRSHDVFASFSPVGELLNAECLVLVPARRNGDVDYEVYDVKDTGDEWASRSYIYEDYRNRIGS